MSFTVAFVHLNFSEQQSRPVLSFYLTEIIIIIIIIIIIMIMIMIMIIFYYL